MIVFFFFQAEDGIRDGRVTGVQTCALPIYSLAHRVTNCAQTSHLVGGVCRLGLSHRDLSPNRQTLSLSALLQRGRLAYDGRSEERRVGKECRTRGTTYP